MESTRNCTTYADKKAPTPFSVEAFIFYLLLELQAFSIIPLDNFILLDGLLHKNDSLVGATPEA